MKHLVLYSILALFFIACSDSKESDSQYLPRATGNPGDILLIMDSIQWRGDLGKQVRKVFQAEVPGLPQGEPMFNIIWVHPSKGFSLLTQMRNVVYVFTLDRKSSGSRIVRQQFSEETINKIRTDTSFNLSTKRDEFARGQEVMYLFGQTEKQLMDYLARQKQNIIDYFNKKERERLAQNLFKTQSTKSVAEFLRKEQKIDLRVPVGFKLADKTQDFVWLRAMTAATDRDVFITWKPYESEYQLLPDSIIAWRNETCKKYLYEDPEKPDTYLTTELEDADVQARQMKLNNSFAMELRGLWRTNNRSMGGPFIGYALIDQPRGLLYYIEGFAYAPGKDKREMIRELETILWTFRTSDQLPK